MARKGKTWGWGLLWALAGGWGLPALANGAEPSWLMLYPQHPLYRRAVETPVSETPSTAVPADPPPVPASPIAPPTAPPTVTVEPSAPSPQPEPSPPAVASNAAPLFIPPIPVPEPPERGQKFFPSFTAGSPSAFGASWGDVFAGLSLIDRSSPVGSPTDKADGSIALGFGLGDATSLAGLEVVYNIISLTPSRFAANGNVDFKLHKTFPDLWSVALGWENAINYGPDAGGTPSSVYGAASKVFVLQPDNWKIPCCWA
ncbi:MAG: hypothetical protein ACUVSQ_04515 [Pseudanabaenaceae cyanobacterium]